MDDATRKQMEELRKPLPATTILLDNVSALLVFLHQRKARDYHFVAIEDVERLLATGRA